MISKWLPVLLDHKVVYCDEYLHPWIIKYNHSNIMTFSPDLELTNSFWLGFLQEMAQKIGKMKCKML
jgi:hypothetical protein